VLVNVSLAGLNLDLLFVLLAVDTFNNGRVIDSSLLLLSLIKNHLETH
jgi:hypothetical protein